MGLQVGWGKQLNYVVGFSKDGVADVSQRYTKDWPAMAVRRRLLPEAAVAQACRVCNLDSSLALPPESASR